MFIDNPIGAGFSYATNSSDFPKTNAEIAADLLECMRGFYNKLPEFRNVPTYIMSESYGGKMAVEFALVWYKVSFIGFENFNLKNHLCYLRMMASGWPFKMHQHHFYNVSSDSI